MKLINKLFFSLIILITCTDLLSAKEDYRIEDQPAALEVAASIQKTGILKQKENGFIYLDIDNAFIDDVIPVMELPGEIRKRPTSSRSMGAHISVFDEHESIQPVELGQVFHFEVKDIRSFTLHSRDGLKKLWVISTESPELEALRESYGLSPRLKGYDYHITLGKQMPAAPEGWQDKHEFSQFDLSEEPTDDLYTEGDFVVVDHPQVLETAKKVNQIGQLCLKSNGYAYVDVDDDFIEKLADQLPVEGTFKPLSTGPKKQGAHISVFHEDETIGKEIWDFVDAGDWFSFEVRELRYFERMTANGVKRCWLLAVDAPGLQRLRKHYGLKPKLQGHDFHITLGSEEVFEAELPEAA